MADYPPPTDNVPIFDASNFITSEFGLTEAQIASKFLRYPTGQGTETLSALITGSITAPNEMNIIMPNTAATNVLNVGVVSRPISGQIHHYSDGDNCVSGAGVHINNGINNASATNIANGTTTTGGVNIMTGATSTGIVSIGMNTTTTNMLGTVNINSTSSTNTSIGNTGTTTMNGSAVNINTLNGTNTTIGKNGSGTNTVRGTTVAITGTTNNITGITNINGVGSSNGGLITIGNATAGTTTLDSGTINIGNINTVNYIEGASVNMLNAASSTMNLMTSASLTGTINVMTGASNTSNLTIGNTTGATNTTTALNGITTISKPAISRPISLPTPGIAASAGQMFFNTNVTSGGFFPVDTTYRAFAPINNMPEGTYLFLGFVYLADYSAVTKIASTLCYSNAAIANAQSTALTLVNQNTLEAYGYKATTGATGGNWTMNLSTVYTVSASPNNNIAVAVQTGVSTIGFYADLKYCRLA